MEINLESVLVALIALLPATIAYLVKTLKETRWVKENHLEDMVDRAVAIGVSAVEAFAKNQYKEDGSVLASAKKLEKAVEIVKKATPEATVISDEVIKAKIEHEILNRARDDK